MKFTATDKILLRAAELIAEHGYRRSGKSGKGLSVWTAVYESASNTNNRDIFDLLDVVWSDGKETELYKYRPWARWEKHPSRTADEVIDALIAAAYWDKP